jgi:hypothetical protein
VKNTLAERPGLFEEAARAGLVTPAFREDGVLSLYGAHKIMLDAYGRQSEAIPLELQAVHTHIINAVDSAIENGFIKPAYWPDPGQDGQNSLGSRFERLVKRLLSVDKPPIISLPSSV